MKRIWKMRRDSEAVSPVIATILMVAITVVLAAVLYVMVMGFGGPSSNPPIAALNYEKTAENTYKISVISIDREVFWSDCKLAVVNNTASDTSELLSGGTVSGIAPAVAYSVELIDLGTGAKVGAGDYFVIKTQADHTYTISILYGTKEDAIGTVTFTAT
ncbi:MAG: type IV pilin N-terminal domain-containing protein [Methanomassiliicoccales archaeon]